MSVLFNLKTNVNVTYDLNLLDQFDSKFNDCCWSANSKKLILFCWHQYTSLNQKILNAKSKIRDLYSSKRSKRSILSSFLSKITVKGALKKTGTLTLIASLGFQEYSNYKLAEQLNVVEDNLKKVSFILLNTTENDQLNYLFNEQKVMNVIQLWTSNIESYIKFIEKRHQDLIFNLYPTDRGA